MLAAIGRLPCATRGVKKISSVKVCPRVATQRFKSRLHVAPVTFSAVSAVGKSEHVDQNALALAMSKAKANNFNIFYKVFNLY
jgi:hypothetical protein